jgi:hypothetical protein
MSEGDIVFLNKFIVLGPNSVKGCTILVRYWLKIVGDMIRDSCGASRDSSVFNRCRVYPRIQFQFLTCLFLLTDLCAYSVPTMRRL